MFKHKSSSLPKCLSVSLMFVRYYILTAYELMLQGNLLSPSARPILWRSVPDVSNLEQRTVIFHNCYQMTVNCVMYQWLRRVPATRLLASVVCIGWQVSVTRWLIGVPSTRLLESVPCTRWLGNVPVTRWLESMPCTRLLESVPCIRQLVNVSITRWLGHVPTHQATGKCTSY
jgi:hypothetical protein